MVGARRVGPPISEKQVAIVQQEAVGDAAGIVPAVDEVAFHIYQVSVVPAVGREESVPPVRASGVVTDQSGGTVGRSHALFLLVAQTKATAKVIGEWISDRVVGSSMCPPVTIWQRPQSVGLADRPAAPVLIKRIVAARPVVNLAQPRFLIPGKWPGTTRMRIAVPDLVSNSYFPAVAAIELGFFRAQGMDVELEMVFPVGRAMEALRDRRVGLRGRSRPCHVVGLPPAGRAPSCWSPCPSIPSGCWCCGSDLEVRPGDVAAVKGLRIGAAPGPDTALRRLLAEAGVDPAADDVALAPVPGSGDAGVSFGVHAAKALEEGTIDGFWANAMGAECGAEWDRQRGA